MSSLRYLNVILTVLTILLAIHLFVGWSNTTVIESSAMAQNSDRAGLPDAGAQRRDIIDQLKKVNTQMDAVMDLLKSGKIKVQVDAGAKN